MRAIYFDLDRTLIHTEPSVTAALEDAFERVAGESPRAWLEAYGDGFVERFQACAPAPYRGGVEHVRAETEFECGVEETVGALLDAEVAATEPTPDAAATLERVAAAHPVGVLTNGVPEWQRAKLAAAGLAGHVDAVVTAYEAGAHKPAPEPFALAERRLPADAYALIGDSDADVDGAASAGWRGVRYDGGTLADAVDRIDWPQ
ncbi:MULTISPECIES: HAD family hydrolase [Halobacterium]|uniref:HAD family hydrolase n=1 Tax=Halobacterium TaxID=2239 RepID=UPI001966AA44|nr:MULTISPECIES: HAD family hydrolase [Halobacterium]MCF2164852.1 HAD family hydrolase [Halobacterium salinarum]MCF2168523.1 HAD family hydrolase [Halobacterium salinarum]MCF2207429.1 HAD family hydrolase [Halobacterium salinarum]MCF2239298.1 HAD family hydrolase [Halobacterium salinarum]MDL0130182.1 HAD family hydrolase [Halobacterium salinarum]